MRILSGDPDRSIAEGCPKVYLASRGFDLPTSLQEMRQVECWFNLWQRKFWPYEEVLAGDILYWYETPSQKFAWHTRIRDVIRFEYSAKDEVTKETCHPLWLN